jgi:hypothetical protein
MSGLAALSERDVEVVQECLVAIVHGPFIPDSEFQTVMGLERADVDRICAGWPNPAESDDQHVAVNNALNNLLGYPHDRWDAWRELISAEPEEVARILSRWRGDDDFDPRARGYFDRLR